MALYLLNLTSSGVTGVIASIKLLVDMEKQGVIEKLWDNEKSMVETICEFYGITVICFSSGFLFVPILVDFISANGMKAGAIILVAIVLYLCLIVASYFLPIIIITKSTKNSKSKRKKEYWSIY